ncbi:Alpha/Beta hydrolase protein [Chlamydoabsidia padenii]|nr:Alpha/Beta hydrolase protein [Chlamydoabsidia padenii]
MYLSIPILDRLSFRDSQKAQYDYEQHLIPTKDNYLLCAHRIPSIKSSDNDRQILNSIKPILNDNDMNIIDCMDRFTRGYDKSDTSEGKKDGKPVVLLYHGFLMSSEIWMCNTNEYGNLPLLLASLGYDVWLGNTRGNKYSQTHLKLDANNINFWNFSLNELAMYDLPDTVDYILETTGQKDLTYIGFSQGTALGFSSLSINKDLNKKINLFIALAPATTPIGLHHPLIDSFVKAAPSIIYLIFGRKMPLELAMMWQRMVSPTMYVRIIDACVGSLFGWTGNNMAPEQKLVSYQHLYSPTSVKTLVHWFQIIRTGQFQMFDEIPSRLPYKRTSSVTDHIPMKFPTKQITTPIALFYGGSDSLVNFEVLSADLPHPLAYIKSIQPWEHLDFIWATGIEDIVFPDIVHLLDHFASSERHYKQ